jgi:hypothetical protein
MAGLPVTLPLSKSSEEQQEIDHWESKLPSIYQMILANARTSRPFRTIGGLVTRNGEGAIRVTNEF